MAKNAPTTTPTTDRLPQEKKSKNQARFTFRTIAGDVIDVPAQGYTPLPVLVALRALHESDEDDVIDRLPLIYDIADTPEGRAGLMKLGTVELGRFMKLWAKQPKKSGADAPKA